MTPLHLYIRLYMAILTVLMDSQEASPHGGTWRPMRTAPEARRGGGGRDRDLAPNTCACSSRAEAIAAGHAMCTGL